MATILANYIDPEILDYAFLDNTVENYLYALGVFILAVIVLRIFKFIVINRLKAWAKKSQTEFDDVLLQSLDKISWGFYMVVALYVAAQFLVLSEIVNTLLFYLLIFAGTYYAVLMVQEIVSFGTKAIVRKRTKEDPNSDTSVIELLSKIVQYSLWLVGGLLILSNLGYDVTPMLAGFGVGGIAIAFALQNVLIDIFASFSIYFDKPFKKGDFIIIGNDLGTVERIGIKSTRIRTLQGQELVVSNKELTEIRVHNYKRMKERRIAFIIGVTYETQAKKLETIPTIVAEIIQGIPLTKFDRCHFKSFGDFSLNYEIVYYVMTSDYNKYMDIQQSINLALVNRFEKEKIGFAYPTQTLYVYKAK